MKCKQCDNDIGKEYVRFSKGYHGDHNEVEITDAGVFCSEKCLVAYCMPKDMVQGPPTFELNPDDAYVLLKRLTNDAPPERSAIEQTLITDLNGWLYRPDVTDWFQGTKA